MFCREGWRVDHKASEPFGVAKGRKSPHESQSESDYGKEMNPVLGCEPPLKIMLSAIAWVMH